MGVLAVCMFYPVNSHATDQRKTRIDELLLTTETLPVRLWVLGRAGCQEDNAAPEALYRTL